MDRTRVADMGAMHDSCTQQTSSAESAGSYRQEFGTVLWLTLRDGRGLALIFRVPDVLA
jgi:hypothetical protein